MISVRTARRDPLFDPDAPGVLADRREQELHCSPLHFAEPPSVEQMDDDRHGGRAQAPEERTVRETKGPERRQLQAQLLEFLPLSREDWTSRRLLMLCTRRLAPVS